MLGQFALALIYLVRARVTGSQKGERQKEKHLIRSICSATVHQDKKYHNSIAALHPSGRHDISVILRCPMPPNTPSYFIVRAHILLMQPERVDSPQRAVTLSHPNIVVRKRTGGLPSPLQNGNTRGQFRITEPAVRIFST